MAKRIKKFGKKTDTSKKETTTPYVNPNPVFGTVKKPEGERDAPVWGTVEKPEGERDAPVWGTVEKPTGAAPVFGTVEKPEGGSVGIQYGTAELTDPSEYTEEDLKDPLKALLARTVGFADRVEVENPWWHRRYRHTKETGETLEVGGYEVPETQMDFADTDLLYYGGAATIVDVERGWARSATDQEMAADRAKLESKGYDIEPSRFIWKDRPSQQAAMKERLSNKALQTDDEVSTAWLDKRDALLEEETPLYTEIDETFRGILEKYNEGNLPTEKEETIATLNRIQSDGTNEEVAFIHFGDRYLKEAQPALLSLAEEREKGARIALQIQKSGWVRNRNVSAEKEIDRFFRQAKTTSGEALAEQAIKTRLVKNEQGAWVPSQDELLAYIGPTERPAKPGMRGAYVQKRLGEDGTSWDLNPNTEIDWSGAGVLKDLEGALLFTRGKLKGTEGIDFVKLAEDPEAYHAKIKEVAGTYDPSVISMMMTHQRAAGALAVYEAKETTEPTLVGQRVTYKTVKTPSRARRVAERNAREVVFYQEVLQAAALRVRDDLEAIGSYSGLDAEAVAEVTLSRKLFAGGSDANKTAFDWEETLRIIQSHQKDIIAKDFGYVDLQDLLNKGVTVDEYTGGDLKKLSYSYTDDAGQEIKVMGPPSRGNMTMVEYINKVAEKRAKTIIREDLAKNRKMVFVKAMTAEQRAKQARATGIPLLYMISVPRSADMTVSVSETGRVTAKGEDFEEWTVMDYSMQVFNGFAAYGGAAATELWKTGTVDEWSRYLVDDRGDFNWSVLGGQKKTKHVVRKGETLEDMALYYFGSDEDPQAMGWMQRVRQEHGLGEDGQLPTGTEIGIYTDFGDTFGKATAAVMGFTDSQRLYEEMDRRRTLMLTEQVLDLAEWGATEWDLLEDDLTEQAMFSALLVPAGILADVRGPDPFTTSLLGVGKGFKAYRNVTNANQVRRTLKVARSAIDESQTYDQLVKGLERVNPGADWYFQFRTAHAMGVGEDVSAHLRSLESQIEREKTLLREAEIDAEQLTLKSEKAAAQARIDASTARLKEMELDRLRTTKETLLGRIDALEKMGARKALALYEKQIEAAKAAKDQADSASSNLKAFQESREWKDHTDAIERHNGHIKEAAQEQTAASAALADRRREVRVVIEDLTVQKRSLDSQLREMKAAHKNDLRAIETEYAGKAKFPDDEWASRAKRAGIDVEPVLPNKLANWKRRVRSAERRKGISNKTDPVDIDAGFATDLAKSRKTWKSQLNALKKRDIELAKKKHTAAKEVVEAELKEIRNDLAGLKWTGKGTKPRPVIKQKYERLLSRRASAAEKVTAARDATKRTNQRARDYLKDSKSVVKKRSKLAVDANRATKAHNRLAGKAWARLAAFAPGVRMAALSTDDAAEVLRNTLADLKTQEIAVDNAIGTIKKEYKELLQAQKTERHSLKEAERALDDVISNQDKQARLRNSVAGKETQTETWRQIALKMADEIEEGNKILKEVPEASTRFVDLLARGTTKVNSFSGERVVDPKILRESLEEKFGKDALAHFFEKQPELSKPLKSVLDSLDEVTLSADQVTDLQQLQEGLLRAREAVHASGDAIATVRSIAQAKGDYDMMRAAMAASYSTKIGRVGGTFLGILGLRPDWWTVTLDRFSRAFNPIKNRIGPTSDEQYQILKAADFQAGMINEDMRLISRAAHGGAGTHIAGGMGGAALEAVNQAKRGANSERAVEMYTQLVDGKVDVLSTRPLKNVEKPEIIAALETEVASLEKRVQQLDRQIAVEKELPGETLRLEVLEEAAREANAAAKELDQVIVNERVLFERMENLRAQIAAEANSLDAQAAQLEAATRVSDNEYAVFNHYNAAIVAKEAGDEALANRRMFQAAEAASQLGQFSKEELPALKESLVFSDAQETILRNAHAGVERKLLEPDRLRAQADDLRIGLSKADQEHPYRKQYNEIEQQLSEATNARINQVNKTRNLEEQLESLQKGLSGERQTTIQGNREVKKLQDELAEAKQKLQKAEQDYEDLVLQQKEVQGQISKKISDTLNAIETAKNKRDSISSELNAAYSAGDDVVVEQANIALSKIDDRIRTLETDLRRVAEPITPETLPSKIYDERGWVWRGREAEDALSREVWRLDEQVIETALGGQALKVSDLEDQLRAAEAEYGFSSLGTTTEEALRAEKSEVLKQLEATREELKTASVLPSHSEVQTFLENTKEGEALAHAQIAVSEADDVVNGLRLSLGGHLGEVGFYDRLLEIAISQKRQDVEELVSKIKKETETKKVDPKTGAVSWDVTPLTTAERIANARAVAQLLHERPLLDSLEKTAFKMDDAAAAQYGTYVDRLHMAELNRKRVYKQHAAVQNDVWARRDRLLSGQEHLPLESRAYSYVVNKKNVPLKIAGRTSASNLGREVPWDRAVHQFKVTDLASIAGATERALEMPGPFAANLKLLGVSEAFMGLARMWVPRTKQLLAPDQALLLKDAARIILDDDTLSFAAIKVNGKQFPGFTEKMREATFLRLERASGYSEEAFAEAAQAGRLAEHEHSVAMGAYNVLRASVIKQTYDRLVKSTGGVFTRKEAEAMNALLGAEKGTMSIPEGSWQDVISGLNKLGTPITQSSVRPYAKSGLGETTARLVRSGETAEGATIYAREDMIQAIEGLFNQATKRADRFYRADIHEGLPTNTAVNALSKAYNFWKQSVTSGLLLPNPHYWMNNVVGDFTQMYFTVGLTTATKVSFNNLPYNVPILGKHVGDFVSNMSHWGLGKAQGKPVLGTIMNGLFNPHTARVWNRRPGAVVFKNGQTVSNERLYKWAVEDGITDSVIQEEFLSLIDRTTTSKITSRFNQAGKVLGNWQEDILLFADFAQKRQRMALYLELLQKGYTRSEARRLTLEALYDWRHGVSQWEAAWIIKMSPFWRFWKNATKQVGRVVLDPLTKPDKVMSELLAPGVGGAAAGNRIRQAMYLKEKGGEWLASENEAYVRFQEGMEEVRLAAKHFLPPYLYEHMFYGAHELPLEDKLFFATPRSGPFGMGGYVDENGEWHGIAPGRSKYPDSPNYDANYAYTHSFSVGPKSSTLEAFSLWATGGVWASSLAWKATGWANGSEENTFSDEFIENFVLSPALKMAGPGTQQAIELLAEYQGMDVPFSSLGRYQYWGGTSSLTPGEATFLTQMNKLPIPLLHTDVIPESVAKGEEPDARLEGKYRTDDVLIPFLMRNTPFIMQLPRKMDQMYFQNPDVDRAFFPALKTAYMQTGGWFTRKKFTDPYQIFTSKQYKINEDMTQRFIELNKELKERQYGTIMKSKEEIRQENIDIIEGRKTIPDIKVIEELIEVEMPDVDKGAIEQTEEVLPEVGE